MAFPFRNFNIGEQVPAVTFSQYNAAQQTSFLKFQGQPLVVIFWGADVSEKKQRSIKVLTILEKLKPFLQKRNIALLSVNIQGDSPLTIKEVLVEAGSTETVFIDQDRSAYKDLGIYIMPAVLLLDKQGLVMAGFGYGRDMVAKLQGEIEIMTGEKTRLQVQKDLQPQMKTKEPAKIKANIHLNAGLHLKKRGFLKQARRELEKAIQLDPHLALAHIELGCLYLDTYQRTKAEKALQIGLQSLPDSLPGQICLARLNALQTKGVPKAIIDLEKIAAIHPAAPEPVYTLGILHEKQGRYNVAADHYKKAYKLLQNLHTETGNKK